ncbi:MAG: lytic transglycosylase domain-containing protein [Nitrospiraceae bacterium]
MALCPFYIDTPLGRRWVVPTFIRRTLAIGALMAATAVADEARADVYMYVDKQGVISLTNVPTASKFKRLDLYAGTPHATLTPRELEPAIAKASQAARLHPALVRAVIKTESNYDPRAVSRAGALGLMQLMPQTAELHHVEDAFDPEQNISGGTKHLRYLLDRFQGNLPLALAAYNAGEHVIDRYQTLPPYDETRQYVKKVLHYYRTFLLSNPSGRHTATSASIR